MRHIGISIQHLFLFILIRPQFLSFLLEFQYNTCFYLSTAEWSKKSILKISIQHLFLFIAKRILRSSNHNNFNTTLVFIYLWLKTTEDFHTSYFNTTLVFIYLFFRPITEDLFYHFNTTLVFIYQMKWKKNHTKRRISIQHLFLFIGRGRLVVLDLWLFQYNTCFYLSSGEFVTILKGGIFQYNTCFYLSFSYPTPLQLSLWFQYNTCFYLSLDWDQIQKNRC